MNILEEIRKKIALFDPELVKNEDNIEEFDPEEDDKNINVDDYQKAIDGAVDPEDLNFSMDKLFGDEDDDEEGTEHLEIPQDDYEEEPIKAGDSVKKVVNDERIGTVLSVGELVEVEWNPELITLEYPEELIHADGSEEEQKELEKVHSIDTNPPIPLENTNTPDYSEPTSVDS